MIIRIRRAAADNPLEELIKAIAFVGEALENEESSPMLTQDEYKFVECVIGTKYTFIQVYPNHENFRLGWMDRTVQFDDFDINGDFSKIWNLKFSNLEAGHIYSLRELYEGAKSYYGC